MAQDGKTLMEAMVVVALIGMLSGMAVPHFAPLYSRTQMQSVTEELASELRLARQVAIASRDRVRLVFDKERQLIVTELAGPTRTHHVYRYGGKGIEIDEPTGGPEIIFHPSGRSATATTIELHNRAGQVRKLTVSITGRVATL